MEYEVLTSDCFGIDKQEIELRVEEYLNQKYFFIFPKKNIALFFRRDFDAYLKSTHRLIKETTVTKIFPNKLEIKVSCHPSYFIWKNQNRPFLVSQNGQVFAEIDASEEEKFKSETVVVSSDSVKMVNIGEIVFDKQRANFFYQVISELEDLLDISFKKEINAGILAANELTVFSDREWKIYFSTERPLENQLKILDALLRETFKDKNMDDLEYVDLRIKGRAIYRFKSFQSEKNSEEDSEADEGNEEESSDTENESEEKDDN